MRKRHNVQYNKTIISKSFLKAKNRIHTKLDQCTISLSAGTPHPLAMTHLFTLALGIVLFTESCIDHSLGKTVFLFRIQRVFPIC